ncbi:hypothetical protein SAMN04488511_11621 [Pedobacter suwonensis]|uniref:Uncharacterized protein n=2 Tax=Pedobacter suwonensis TaxID=332999 RepID=A0A1I0TXK4_9SPHI|nr:hypothetical protein SAMN04488511_11621 [Pedobacter suwonensis]
MSKVSLCLIAMIFLVSCGQNKKYDQNQYNIQFLYNPWINLDFNTGVVEVSVAKYRDTIHIAEKDKKLIMDSFNDNGIGSLEGNIFVDSKRAIMPPDNFQFKVIKGRKRLSDITVSNTDPITDGKNKRILNFKKTVADVLNRNNDFKAAKQAFAQSGVVIY